SAPSLHRVENFAHLRSDSALRSGASHPRRAETIETMIAAKMAEKKNESMVNWKGVNPLSQLVSASISALITIENSPKVRQVIGAETKLRIGLMKALASPKMSPMTRQERYMAGIGQVWSSTSWCPVIVRPGRIQDATQIAHARTTTREMKFIVLILPVRAAFSLSRGWE